MANTSGADVRDRGEELDVRAARSLSAVRGAIAAVLFEGEFDRVTIQQLIKRAGVARTTFYAHFRNKDDALLASFEGMMAMLERGMDTVPARRGRLVPLTELLTHFQQSEAVFHALRDARRLETIWSLGSDLVADMIQRRAPQAPVDAAEQRLRARMLAGACLELVRWWTEQPAPPPPASLDDRFHLMARLVISAR